MTALVEAAREPLGQRGAWTGRRGLGLLQGLNRRARRNRRIGAADVLLPAALATWIVAVGMVNPDSVDDWGLLPALPIAFFFALGLLVLSIVLVLSVTRLSPLRLGLHLVALVLVLQATVPLIFPEPNYSWAYKHIGVVDYINLHRGLNTSVDIYQNWPGFFAVAGWLTKVAGVGSPLVFAKWAPVYFNLLVCLELAFAFRWLPVERRVAWLGLFLFAAGNWVGQDYFAPQALAFVLSLAVFGMVLAVLQADRPPGPVILAGRLARWAVRAGRPEGGAAPVADDRAQLTGWSRRVVVGLLFTVDAVVVVTHQLSPFMVLLGIGLLVLAGLVRPWWVICPLAALAVGYFMAHLSFLQGHGDLRGSPLNPRDLLHVVSNPFDNAHSLKSGGTNPMPGRKVTALGAPAMILGLWAVGAIGAVRRLRAGRPTLVLVLLAGSPALVALVQNYGGEAIFRIFLFSLPWTAVLVASAIAPRSLRWGRRSGLEAGLALSIVIVLFMSAFYGSVELYRVRPGALAASRYFYDNATPGSVLGLVAPDVPTRVGAEYDRFLTGSTPPDLSSVPEFQHRILGAADVALLSRMYQEHADLTRGDVYLFLSTDQAVYTQVLGLMPEGALAGLDGALARSPRWPVFYRNADATIYRYLPDAAPQAGASP